MNNRWFKEEREAFSGDQLHEELESTEKALEASTLIKERLARILEEDIAATYHKEEDVTVPNYAISVALLAGERKAYKKILTLIKGAKTNG